MLKVLYSALLLTLACTHFMTAPTSFEEDCKSVG